MNFLKELASIIEPVEDYNYLVMRKIRLYWYFVYYSLHKFWFKISGGYKFAFFQADVSLGVLILWLIGLLMNIFKYYFNLNFYNYINIKLLGLIIIIIYIYNLWFVNNENHIHNYFYYFENLPRKKKIRWHAITWIIICVVIIGFWSTIGWMRME